jgi:integrase
VLLGKGFLLLEIASMPRIPKPFPWRDGWYTDAGGKRTRLLDKSASFSAPQTALRQHLNDLDKNGGRAHGKLTVAELIALFLDTVQVENAEQTYIQYQRWLARFAKVHGSQQASQITTMDGQQFKNKLLAATCPTTKKPYMPRTINSGLIVLKRCWNWAIDTESFGLTKNPFRKIKLLPEKGRERIATDEEFRKLLRHSDALFRQVLLCLRFMPIRPQDLRTLQWQGENEVDFANHCWIIRIDKTTKTRKNKQPKIVMMPPFVEQLLQWRQAQSASPFVFVNEDGNQWTKDTLSLRMRRLRDRASIEADANGEHIVLYTNRHTYMTKAASVMTPPELQALAGHTDYRTTKRYVHLAQQQKVLTDAARRAVDALRPQPRSGK